MKISVLAGVMALSVVSTMACAPEQDVQPDEGCRAEESGQAAAGVTVEFQEWDVPGGVDTFPHDPAFAPDGTAADGTRATWPTCWVGLTRPLGKSQSSRCQRRTRARERRPRTRPGRDQTGVLTRPAKSHAGESTREPQPKGREGCGRVAAGRESVLVRADRRGRAPEGCRLSSTGPRRERVLPVQVDSRRSTSKSDSRSASCRIGACVQRAQSNDRAWSTRVVRDRSVTNLRVGALGASFDLRNNAVFSAGSTRRAALHELVESRSGVRNLEAREALSTRIEHDHLVLTSRQIDAHEDIV